MQYYTKEELDSKIKTFLTAKFKKYPKLNMHKSRRSKRWLREFGGMIPAFRPTQIKPQF